MKKRSSIQAPALSGLELKRRRHWGSSAFWLVGAGWLACVTNHSADPDEWLARAEQAALDPIPFAYLLAPAEDAVVQVLQKHGIEAAQLREDIVTDCGFWQIEKAEIIADAPPSGVRLRVEASRASGSDRVPAGTRVIVTTQKKGRLAAYLLDPNSDGALAARELLPVTAQTRYAIRRLDAPRSLLTRPLPDLNRDRSEPKRPVTFEALFGEKKADFSGSPTRIEGWSPDSAKYFQVRGEELHEVDPETGASTPWPRASALKASLRALEVIPAKTAKTISRRTNLQFNASRTAALVEFEGDLYAAFVDGSPAVRLTRTPGLEELATFSPNGAFVAFVRDQNLWVTDLQTQRERQLTTDGGGSIRNGIADWVYFEELFGRSWKAYEWSPDSRRIAFYRFDSSALPTFHALNTLPIHGRLVSMPHPKAGDPNPEIRIGTVTVAGSAPQWADLSAYVPSGYIVSWLGWTPDSSNVLLYVQDRIQTWLDARSWNIESGSHTNLFRDQTAAWIESPGPPRILDDGSFLFLSDRTGWRHLYRFHPKESQWDTLTSGEWEVRELLLVHEASGWIYFTGTRDSHIAHHLYRCRLDGSAIERLTSAPGHHRTSVSPDGKWFIDTHSRFDSPAQVTLFRTTGESVRLLDSNPVPDLENYRFGSSELFQIETKDGFLLEASLTYPPDFSPDARYPVWFMTYAGPKAQTVWNSWGRSQSYDQMLAQLGIIVFRADPRSASGKGSVSAWSAYRQLGIQELQDITEAIEWLKQKPFVDPARIGMSGHSYGGFMTAFALTHSTLFSAGISGAPVTDWHFYDSIYTERFMDIPQNNPEGYTKTSVVKAAKNLHGRLLLLHGLMDDNVHLQNSTQLIHALQDAGKTFELMVYPEMKHGLHGNHYQKMLVDFITRTMLGKDQ